MEHRIGMEIRVLSKYMGRYLDDIHGIDCMLSGPQGLILIYLCENDKRMKKIKATEHAYSTVEKIDNHVIQLEKIMLDGIDEKEVKQFRNTISKMTLNLVKESKNG